LSVFSCFIWQGFGIGGGVILSIKWAVYVYTMNRDRGAIKFWDLDRVGQNSTQRVAVA
jgi:hypothetical protein